MGDIFKLETDGYGIEIHGNTISRARIAPQGSQCESNGVHFDEKTRRGYEAREEQTQAGSAVVGTGW